MKTNNAIALFIGCVMLFLTVLIATPPGGWHKSNLHAEDYKLFFLISVLCVVASAVLLHDAMRKEK